MKFVPPYFYRPDVCQCQLCVDNRAEQEVQRVVRVLAYWKANVSKRKPRLHAVKEVRA